MWLPWAAAAVALTITRTFGEVFTMSIVEDTDRIACVGTCIETFTGKFFDLAAPDPAQVDIADIAHALAHECRFGGHCKFFYSVAQHSVLIAEHFPYNSPLFGLALLHDAHEAYCKDIPRPFKHLLSGYKEMSEAVQAAIHEALLPDVKCGSHELAALKREDNAMCRREAEVLMQSGGEIWKWDGVPVIHTRIESMRPAAAELYFIDAWTKWKRNA